MLSNAFFLGKGGVGKTTVSASFALRLARSGKRVLIASL
ncbi:MAG TPA: ArsA-related P-loop ATPase, partial [Spirochaetales bacterium]|nr:ArsA-related P-loop ATPase [Spirochaetales bacterium]